MGLTYLRNQVYVGRRSIVRESVCARVRIYAGSARVVVWLCVAQRACGYIWFRSVSLGRCNTLMCRRCFDDGGNNRDDDDDGGSDGDDDDDDDSSGGGDLFSEFVFGARM